MSDSEAFELMTSLMHEGVKMIVTSSQDILYYCGQIYVFTVLRAQNRVLVEYGIRK
ncbi:hypothetical protein VNN36_06180 [Lactococcus garvieae]